MNEDDLAPLYAHKLGLDAQHSSEVLITQEEEAISRHLVQQPRACADEKGA